MTRSTTASRQQRRGAWRSPAATIMSLATTRANYYKPPFYLISKEDDDDGFDDFISSGPDQDTPNDPDDPTYDLENEVLCPWDLEYGA